MPILKRAQAASRALLLKQAGIDWCFDAKRNTYWVDKQSCPPTMDGSLWRVSHWNSTDEVLIRCHVDDVWNIKNFCCIKLQIIEFLFIKKLKAWYQLALNIFWSLETVENSMLLAIILLVLTGNSKMVFGWSTQIRMFIWISIGAKVCSNGWPSSVNCLSFLIVSSPFPWSHEASAFRQAAAVVEKLIEV